MNFTRHPGAKPFFSATLVAHSAILLSAGISVSVIFGTVGQRVALTRWDPSATPMVLETAVAVLMTSFGLRWAQQRRPYLTRLIACSVLPLAIFNLFIHGYPTVFPRFAFMEIPAFQMAQITSLALILVSGALLVLSRANRSIWVLWVVPFLGTLVATIGLITILGYASGLNFTPWWGTFLLKMAVPSAVTCCAMGIALVALFFQHAAGANQQLSFAAAVLGVVGLLILFAGVDTAVLLSSNSILTNRGEIQKNAADIRAVQSLVELARTSESGQRGYLLTGEKRYLEDFFRGQQGYAESLRDSQGQNARLLQTVQLKFDELNRTIVLEQQGRHQKALRVVKTAEGLHLMEDIETQAQMTVARLQNKLTLRLDESRQSVLSVRKMILWSYGLALGFAAGSLLFFFGEIRRRSRVEEELREKESRLAGMNQELREQTSRAEEASIAKSSFLASMSHEIRTPMNAILGMADMLWESELSETQRHYVEVFRRAGGNLLALINDILDLSKIESGTFCLETVEFSPRDIVEQLLEILTPKAQSKNISLRADFEPETTNVVVGDPARLQQVLLNLLGNAIKFTERGGVLLTVRSHSTATHATLKFEISDSGIGIAEGKLSSIFDDFTQAETSTTRRFGGTGLGLGISQRLVRFMGGNIEVQSALGSGSTFFFTIVLPVGAEPRTSGPVELDEIAGNSVLIVDNDPITRIVLSEMCTAWGLVVSLCSSGEQAVESTRASLIAQRFALALVDRIMPEMDGFETAVRMRALDPGIAILMVSSDNQSGDISRAREFGFSSYLLKPVRRAELLQHIVKALSRLAEPFIGPALEAPSEHFLDTPNRLSVLVAEDSEDNRFLLQAYCKATHYDLAFAENGEKAVAAYQSGSFDLVLMDVQMPVMDGLAATREIRNLEIAQGRNRVPILALTANAMLSDVTRAIDAGCDAHLAKPVSKKNFLSVLDQWRTAFVSAEPSFQAAVHAPSKIEIPEGLEELALSYLVTHQQELDEIEAELDHSDFEHWGRLAHNLKGSGTSFGFPEITRLGAALEKSSIDRNLTDFSRQLTELSAYVGAARQEMEAAGATLTPANS